MKKIKKMEKTHETHKTKIIIGVVFSAAALLLLLFLVPLSTGTNEVNINEENIIEIRERMFIQQILDIYTNTDEYLGKTVRFEGIYGENPGRDGEEPTRFVFRHAPGCCGYDGMVGLLVILGDCPAPEPNAWVEATGKVDTIVSEVSANVEFVVLRLSSLRVLETRGREFVSLR